jgi:parvulin-like peptidyl-prolyl isomerase
LQHSATVRAEIVEASTDQLQAIYTKNKAIGAVPARFSFEHIFFDVSKADAKARAELAFQEKSFYASTSDVFLDGNQFFALAPGLIRTKFGDDFAVALSGKDAPMGEWFGPVKSVYGFHLVRLNERQASYRRPVAELGPELESIWQNEQQALHWQNYLENLRHQYRVECHAPN